MATISSGRPSTPVIVALTALSYWLAAYLGQQLALPGTNASPLWPAAGVAFAAVILFGYRACTGVYLGSFFGNMIGVLANTDLGAVLAISALSAIGGTVEAAAGLYLLRRILDDDNLLQSLAGIGKFGLISLLMCLTSAPIGATTLALFEVVPWNLWDDVWVTWWLGDVAGVITATPLILSWWWRDSESMRSARGIAKECALYLILIAVCYGLWFNMLDASSVYAEPYVPFLLMLFGIVRFGPREASTGVAILSGMAVWSVINGTGPFVKESVNLSLLSTQIYVCVTAFAMLFIASAIAQSRTAQENLSALNVGLDETVAARTRDLREAVELSEAANRSKSAFLANMSHEIRTPLNAIMGFTEILNGRLKDRGQLQYLDSIIASGKALVTLIDDLLDLSKVETGTLAVKPGPTDIRALLRDVELVYTQKAHDKGLRLEVEIDPGMPEVLVIDEGRTRQILANLIDNAIKFTRHGHVRLTAAGSRQSGDPHLVDLTVVVADTGIGIPDNQLDRVFKTFEQREGQSINEYGGVGRGLSLVAALLDLMGGEIKCESQVEVGSRFTMTLPDVAVSSANQLAAIEAQGFDAESIEFAPASVLIADDVSTNRDLIKGFLDGQPLSFLEAENGEETIDKARQERVGLILMDIKMPVLDGFSASRMLKADEQTRSIPIVALTGSVLRESEGEILEVCEGFLRKPVARVNLIREMSRWLPCAVSSSTPTNVLDEADEARENSIDGAPERAAELVAKLKGQQQDWEELERTLTINDIDEFAHRISTMGGDHGYRTLQTWGQQLSAQAAGFDLENMKKTLSRYPELIAEIEELNS